MVYALNVFNLVEGEEGRYKDYSVKAGRMIYQLGGRVVSSGFRPLRHLKGDVKRSYFIVVEFPNEMAFNEFHQQAEEAVLHPLREKSTCDYEWILFQPWDLKEWVRN